MKKYEFDEIMTRLTKVKGQPLNEALRTGSMLCLGFGEKIKSKTVYKTNSGTFETKETQRSKYVLHIESFFRITFDDDILLTRDDMFMPSTLIQCNDFDEENFQWDEKGNNKLDEKLSQIFARTKESLCVKEVQVSKVGDLHICLSDDYNIDVFIDTSETEECWRFFEAGNNELPHIVVPRNK